MLALTSGRDAFSRKTFSIVRRMFELNLAAAQNMQGKRKKNLLYTSLLNFFTEFISVILISSL